jgi:hypothetical protein
MAGRIVGNPRNRAPDAQSLAVMREHPEATRLRDRRGATGPLLDAVRDDPQ